MGTSPEFDLACLMGAGQAGDQDAYRLLLKTVRAEIVPFIRRYVRDASAVEDIVQESLIGIHNARHTFDPERDFRPWMYAIVRFKVTDYFRKLGRNKWLEGYGQGDNVVNYPSLGSLSRGQVEELIDAVECLPNKQREALIMMKIDGLSVRDAARESGMTEAAVKVAAHRAYRAVREKIGG